MDRPHLPIAYVGAIKGYTGEFKLPSMVSKAH
jgi:hypothetical protein